MCLFDTFVCGKHTHGGKSPPSDWTTATSVLDVTTHSLRLLHKHRESDLLRLCFDYNLYQSLNDGIVLTSYLSYWIQGGENLNNWNSHAVFFKEFRNILTHSSLWKKPKSQNKREVPVKWQLNKPTTVEHGWQRLVHYLTSITTVVKTGVVSDCD